MSDAYVQSSPSRLSYVRRAASCRAVFLSVPMLTRSLASTEALLLHLLFTVVTVPFRYLRVSFLSSI